MNFAFFHMDNLLVNEKYEDHLRHLKQIFKQIREAGLKLKLSKCTFCRRYFLQKKSTIQDT